MVSVLDAAESGLGSGTPLHTQTEPAVRAAVKTKGAFVWDQSRVRIIGIMRVSVFLGAILIPEYLDFHSSYSASRSRIAGIYSRICCSFADQCS